MSAQTLLACVRLCKYRSRFRIILLPDGPDIILLRDLGTVARLPFLSGQPSFLLCLSFPLHGFELAPVLFDLGQCAEPIHGSTREL